MYSIVYILIVSQIILSLANYTLVPSQVLLPRTSFYRCKRTNEILTVNVQFILKIEPLLCVNWKLQNPLVLVFDKNNYTALQKLKEIEDPEESEHYKDDELKGCSPSVVITTVPLHFKDDPDKKEEEEDGGKGSKQELKTSSDIRTFVFAYDSKFRFHAVAEVLISKLDRLTVETSYRKISKNQTFTIRLRGLDKEGNTFSSLEGMPFYMSLEGPKVLEVIKVREGELYSQKREEVLSQEQHFELPENSTLVTDLVVLKGVKVGRVNVKFGLFFDEYKQVYTTPVEFTVNDSVVLSNQNVYMLNNTSFQLTLQYPKGGALYPNGKGEDINPNNYEWSTDGDESKVTLRERGLITAHVPKEEEDGENTEKEYKCVVYVKDLRTNEVLKSFINVTRPYALTLNYNSLNKFNSCLTQSNNLFKKEGLLSTKEQVEEYLEKVVEAREEDEECFERSQKNVVYLFENNDYLFKFNLLTYNKNVFNTFDGSSMKLRESEASTQQSEGGKQLLKLVKSKENYHVYKAVNLGCRDYSLAYESELEPVLGEAGKLTTKYKFCVLEQVKLPGFEPNSKYKTKDNKEYPCCGRPLVVSSGDVFELTPKGGTGSFKYELEGCYAEGNQFLCTERGSYLLKVVDANNEENLLVLQVVATTVKASSFQTYGSPKVGLGQSKANESPLTKYQDREKVTEEEEEVNVRMNGELRVKWRLFGDLEGIKPMFKTKFGEEDEVMYTSNFSNLGYLAPKGEYGESEDFGRKSEAVRLLMFDEKVMEMKEYKRAEDGSWEVTFKPVHPDSTKLEVNVGWLRELYRLQKREREVELSERQFKKLVVNVYKDPVLFVSADYQLPVINLTLLGKRDKEEDLANIPLGSKVELNYKYGIKGVRPKLTKKSNKNVLYVENLNNDNSDGNFKSEKERLEGFVVYCVNLGEEELVFEHLDFRREYRVKCSQPSYSRVYPLNAVGSNLYELALEGREVEKSRYLVNRNKVNRFLNLMFDSTGELLVPSEVHESEFEVYLLEKKDHSQNKEESARLLENKRGNMLEFKLNSSRYSHSKFTTTVGTNNKDKENEDKDDNKYNKYTKHKDVEEECLLKVVGVFKYVNDARKYSNEFNRENKFKKFNQFLVNSLRNSSWKLENKLYVLKSFVQLQSKENHKMLMDEYQQRRHQLNKYREVDDYGEDDYKERAEDLYLMNNEGFVYRMYVYGGSGNYRVTSASKEVEFSVSGLSTFPEKASKREKERMLELAVNRSETLPVRANEGRDNIVNLFTARDLRGVGRFVTFAVKNLTKAHFRVTDEEMLWQDTLSLKFHLKNANKLKVLLTPFAGKEKEEVEVGEHEELVYAREKFKLKGFGFFEGNELLRSTMLFKVKVLTPNLVVKTPSNYYYNYYHKFDNNKDSTNLEDSDSKVDDTVDGKNGNNNLEDKKDNSKYDYYGKNEVVLKGDEELELVTSAVGTSELELSDLEGKVVKTCKLKVVERPKLNYNKVLVIPETRFDLGFENVSNYGGLTVKVKGSGREQRALENHTLEFRDEGVYDYEVDLMYEGNPLTKLSENLKVKVRRPKKMKVEVGTEEKRRMNLPEREEEESLESNLEEFEVERNSVVNLNVLMREGNELFTPLYLKHKRLQFEYKLSKGCELLTNNHNNANNCNNNSYYYDLLKTESNEKEVRTGRYNVLVLVKGDCEVTVNAKFEGKLLESKRVKFRTKSEETLFKGEAKSAQFELKDAGVCCGETEENNLSYRGLYEINKRFTTFPENRLSEVAKNLYRVTGSGMTMLSTRDNTYNVSLLKPTHFSLLQVNANNSMDNAYYNSNNEKEEHFESCNMRELVFRVALYSNLRRLKTPKNAKISLKMKDLSVFSYELKEDVLVLRPNKLGETTLEVSYSLTSDYNKYNYNMDVNNNNGDVTNKDSEDKLTRIYFVKSLMDEGSKLLKVYRGSRVYLSGGRVTELEVNLNANSHEFEKYLKNKNLVKTFGVNCFGRECTKSYVNRNEDLDSVEKLREAINANRVPYKVLTNLVTDSLNLLLNTSSYSSNSPNFNRNNVENMYSNNYGNSMDNNEYGNKVEKSNQFYYGKLLNVSRMEERLFCSASGCRVALRFKLSKPVSESKVRLANQMIGRFFENRHSTKFNRGKTASREAKMFEGTEMSEEVEEVLSMLASPLLGLGGESWTSLEGPGKNEVKMKKVGSFKFRSLSNEEVEVRVADFRAGDYRFAQVDGSTILLLPSSREEVELGNREDVLCEGLGVKGEFASHHLNKLFCLRPIQYPLSGNYNYNFNFSKDNTSATNDGNDYKENDNEHLMQLGENKLMYRLGVKLLLVNRNFRDWSVLKNQLRTMSTEALKGKHKVKLQLFDNNDYNDNENRDNKVFDKDNKQLLNDNSKLSNKDNGRLLLEEEMEVEVGENVLFVDNEGVVLGELTEKNMNQILHVYPASSSYSLYLANDNYLIKTVEKSGQLTTFVVYANLQNGGGKEEDERKAAMKERFSGSNFLMVLNEDNQIVGRIKITGQATEQPVRVKLSLWNAKNLSDFVLLGLTLLILVFFFVVYNTLRNHHYYQPTVPIKLERTLPKVFDHLHQTNYKYHNYN